MEATTALTVKELNQLIYKHQYAYKKTKKGRDAQARYRNSVNGKAAILKAAQKRKAESLERKKLKDKMKRREARRAERAERKEHKRMVKRFGLDPDADMEEWLEKNNQWKLVSFQHVMS